MDLSTKDQHVTTMPDGSALVLRDDPLLSGVQAKLWADHAEGSTLLGYVADAEFEALYRPGRFIPTNDPLFITKARQMYLRTF